MKRTLTACNCRYQLEYPWGYQVWHWADTPTPWFPVATTVTVDEAARVSASFSHVLIACRGCGKELCREMPVPHTTSPGRIELEMFQ